MTAFLALMVPVVMVGGLLVVQFAWKANAASRALDIAGEAARMAVTTVEFDAATAQMKIRSVEAVSAATGYATSRGASDVDVVVSPDALSATVTVTITGSGGAKVAASHTADVSPRGQ